MSDVAVVGAGSWGTAFASVLAANKVDTVLWGRRPETVEEINVARKNEAYLPGVELPPSLRATHDLEEALARAPVVVIGIPSHAFREKVVEIAPMLNGDAMLVSLTKGIERDTLMRMSEVAAEAAGVSDDRNVAHVCAPVSSGTAAPSGWTLWSSRTSRSISAITRSVTSRRASGSS